MFISQSVVNPLSSLDESTWSDQTYIMKVINVQQAKTHLSRLIDSVAAGECILLAKHGKPLAKLSPYCPEKETRPLGGLEGQIRISDDFDEEDPRIKALFEGV